LVGEPPGVFVAYWWGIPGAGGGGAPPGREAAPNRHKSAGTPCHGVARPTGNGDDPPRALRPRTDVLEYPIDNEALVYDPVIQMLYHLNQSALFVWHNCAGRTIEETASALTGTFNVELGTAVGHVAEVVACLSTGGLLNESVTDAVEV